MIIMRVSEAPAIRFSPKSTRGSRLHTRARRLGAYVLMTLGFNILVALGGVMGLGGDFSNCDGPIQIYFLVALAIGVINISFSVYLQHRVFRGAQEEMVKNNQNPASQTPKALMAAAWKVTTYIPCIHRYRDRAAG